MRASIRTVLSILITMNAYQANAAELASDGRLAISFNGRITPERVDSFIRAMESTVAKTLVINSDGGDIEAGMRFGRWIREKRLDVEVSALCRSACANYIFPAGIEKRIQPGALVLWHGSMEQKDIREFQSAYETRLLESLTDAPSSAPEERLFLESNRWRYELARNLRESQARLFDDLQVDEYITRLGQEPVDFGIDLWTATPQVMSRFGITRVSAPAEYGTIKFLKNNPVARIILGGKLLSFDLDEQGRVVRATK